MLNGKIKKLFALGALLAFSLTVAGCDDDSSDKRRADRHRYDRDRRDHRNNPPPPPPPPPKDRHHDKDRNRDKDKNTVRERRPAGYPPRYQRERAPRSEMVGEYAAYALNDASAPKGTSVYIDITEDDNGELFLELPNGADYQISFNDGKGSVAGGTIEGNDNGNFVYKDKKGGMWLVEKVD